MYDRSRCTSYQMTLDRCDVTQPDANGDRPLHAAATGGNEDCMRTLLSVGGLLFADPQPRSARK